MPAFVARQPIFDRNKQVHGYELLFRSGLENYCDRSDGDQSTLDVIANSLLVIGFDDLTSGKRGFINFTRNLLVREVPTLLSKDRVTVEIMEDVEPDAEVLTACQKLKQTGYVLAMDDFVFSQTDSPFVELANIVKVDFTRTTSDQQKTICQQLGPKGISLLAEKVETPEQYDQALAWGYSYFQGYFFSKPVIRSGKPISASKLVYLRLIQEANRPVADYAGLEELIKHDVSLSHSLLRLMNSAWFGFRAKISSIKHALVLLGPKEIRKWLSVVGLRNLAGDKPEELVLRSLIRARVAEGIGSAVGMEEQSSELFLMGMFSLIDALTDMPLAEALTKLPLGDEIKSALLEGTGKFAAVHHTVLSYERAQWQQFSRHAAELHLDEAEVPRLFSESTKWADQAFSLI